MWGRIHGDGPVHSALREATSDLHACLDAQLGGGFSLRGDYARYLRGMHAFLGTARDARPARRDWADAHAHLAADLDAMALTALRARPVARVDDEAAGIGWDYVVDGASLGARMLLRDAGALGIDAAHGGAFLAHHAAAGSQWPRRLAGWAAHPRRDEAGFVERACAAAREAFAHAVDAMAAAGALRA